MEYKPSEKALLNPRRAFLKGFGWVGIGGEIRIPNTPPKLPLIIVIPECTQEQYEHFYNSGQTDLIYAVASTESHIGKRKRRKTSHRDVQKIRDNSILRELGE
jgi:hypothetical protein